MRCPTDYNQVPVTVAHGPRLPCIRLAIIGIEWQTSTSLHNALHAPCPWPSRLGCFASFGQNSKSKCQGPKPALESQ